MENRVNVYSYKTGYPVDNIPLPSVFLLPLRTDLLKFVHQSISKNKRQPYSVNSVSGTKTSAKSWGPGRAVARVPRVPGSGTHRNGQGAVVNMCRGGRIFGPTTIWRKWHHKINKNQRHQALMTAIAASGVTPLILARGFKLTDIPEIPFVLESSWESLCKIKETIKTFEFLGIDRQLLEKKKKKTSNPGKGKMRNRKFKTYHGPLVIYEKSIRFLRNIPSIQFCHISSINLLKLAPGGHVGRFVIWTQSSFLKLESLFPYLEPQTEKNKSNHLNVLNLDSIINSSGLQENIRQESKSLKHF